MLTKPGQPGLAALGGFGGFGARLGAGDRRPPGCGEGGIVDQDCDGAQGISRLCDQPGDIVAVGQIGAHRHRAPAGRLDLGDRLADGPGQPVVPHLFGAADDSHRRALGRQRQRDRPAQAAAGAGDDRGAVGKPAGPRHRVTPCLTIAVV